MPPEFRAARPRDATDPRRSQSPTRIRWRGRRGRPRSRHRCHESRPSVDGKGGIRTIAVVRDADRRRILRIGAGVGPEGWGGESGAGRGGGSAPEDLLDRLAGATALVDGPREGTITLPAPAIEELLELVSIEPAQGIVEAALGDRPFDQGSTRPIESVELEDRLDPAARRHERIRRPLRKRGHRVLGLLLGDLAEPPGLVGRLTVEERVAARLRESFLLDDLESRDTGEDGLGAFVREADPDPAIGLAVAGDQFDLGHFADAPFGLAGMTDVLAWLVLHEQSLRSRPPVDRRHDVGREGIQVGSAAGSRIEAASAMRPSAGSPVGRGPDAD